MNLDISLMIQQHNLLCEKLRLPLVTELPIFEEIQRVREMAVYCVGGEKYIQMKKCFENGEEPVIVTRERGLLLVSIKEPKEEEILDIGRMMTFSGSDRVYVRLRCAQKGTIGQYLDQENIPF